MGNQTYRIGEVARMLGLETYVLRFWESEFPQLAPKRTPKGQRLYTDKHIAAIRKVRELLHEQGMTIEGARKILSRPDGSSPAWHASENEELRAALADVRNELSELRDLLHDMNVLASLES